MIGNKTCQKTNDKHEKINEEVHQIPKKIKDGYERREKKMQLGRGAKHITQFEEECEKKKLSKHEVKIFKE
jgi:hypothetical protein